MVVTLQMVVLGGFEVSIDPLYTIFYSPFNIKNDTGLPCFTVPITDELINYVDFRGPKVMDVYDLELIGNCSSMSYCDKRTKTCQPKRPLDSPCQYNMQCYFGIDGIPGFCANNTCSIRQDIPQYYYNTPRWTMGDQWQSAVIAVLITGVVAIGLLVGRAQVKKLVSKLKDMMEKWQNPDTSTTTQASMPFVANETAWNQHHNQQKRWWKQVPGMTWVYSRLKRGGGDNDQYYQLDTRGDEPPPYRGD
ncbi:hypothetical protein [Parasitella parasitica]|uniref:Uncharacterized protein n=1 Tax=Parasitella parasitica TaxID=35722 RepID=A0A0B7NKU2_9FUNG|nr:hypothetical protein [Parasitella parasitica]